MRWAAYHADPLRPVSSASKRATLIVRVGHVPLCSHQRVSALSSPMPMTTPLVSSYVEPFPVLSPGVESGWDATSATCPGQRLPGIVTMATSDWYGVEPWPNDQK